MNLGNFFKVVKFTITQQVKGKAFKISTIIILLSVVIMSSLGNIIPAMSAKKDNKDSINGVESEFKINTIYYNNNSDLKIDISENIKDSYKDLEFINTTDSKEVAGEKLKNTKENMVYVYVSKSEGGYYIELLKPSNSELVNNKDAKMLTEIISSSLNARRLINSGVNPENLQKVMLPINTEILNATEATSTVEERIMKTILPIIASVLLFYMIYIYGYWVANSIVAEKTSRVMELLLTSTKPMELIIGKCVGMGTLAITQFIAIILTAVLSLKVSGEFTKKIIFEDASVLDITTITSTVSIGKMLIIILFFILGYILYSILNALLGATVSKLEDLNMAMMPVSTISILGFYLALGALQSQGIKGISTIASYVPFSSPFYIPSAILGGNVTSSQIIIGLVILIITIVLLMLFTVRVYSVVILHNGNRLKIKDLISIFSTEQ